MSNFSLENDLLTTTKMFCCYLLFFIKKPKKVHDEKTLVLLSPFYNAEIKIWVSHGQESSIFLAGV